MAETTIGLSVSLGISGINEITKLDRGFAKIRDSIKATTVDMDRLNSKLDELKNAHQKMAGFKAKISDEFSNVGETIAKVGAFALPVKLAMDYESAMVDVKKYIEFDSDEQFKALGEQIKAISKDYGVDFKEIVSIAASGGQQGLAAKDISQYTRLVSKMATAFDMSGAEAADAAAYVMNNFKLSTKELEKLGNQMNFLDDKMSMVASNKLFDILNRTSSNANVLGLGADAAAALGASMLSLGKAPEVASTALNSLYGALGNLDGQAPKFHKALSKIGLDAQYLKTALKKDAAGAVWMFLNAIGKANADDRMGILTDMFGKEFSDDIGSLVTSSQTLNQAFDLIKQNSAGSLDEAMELKLGTAQSNLERLRASMINLGISVGNAFMPIVGAVSKVLSVVVDFLAMVATEFPTVTKIALGVVGGFLAWGALLPIFKIISLSLGVMGGQIMMVVRALSLATTIFNLKYLATLKLNTVYLISATRLKILRAWAVMSTVAMKLASGASVAFAGALNVLKIGALAGAGAMKILRLALISTGIGALIVGIGLAAAFVIQNWDKVKAFFGSIWESVKPYWEATTQFLGSIWQGFSAFLMGIFSPVVAVWNAIFNPVIAVWNGVFSGFFEWVSAKFAWITQMVSSVFSAVGKVLGFGEDKKMEIVPKVPQNSLIAPATSGAKH